MFFACLINIAFHTVVHGRGSWVPPLFAERNSNSSAVIFIFFSVRNALTEYVCQFRNRNLSW